MLLITIMAYSNYGIDNYCSQNFIKECRQTQYMFKCCASNALYVHIQKKLIITLKDNTVDTEYIIVQIR